MSHYAILGKTKVACGLSQRRCNWTMHLPSVTCRACQIGAINAELLDALQDALAFIDLVRLQARRMKDVEQEIEAQDSLTTARAAISRATGDAA